MIDPNVILLASVLALIAIILVDDGGDPPSWGR